MQTNKHDDKVGNPERGPKPVTVSFNGQPVELPKGEITGAEIKAAAIAQGVSIQPDFSLFRRGKDGLEPIRDGEEIRPKKGEKFSAVAPDDVS